MKLLILFLSAGVISLSFTILLIGDISPKIMTISIFGIITSAFIFFKMIHKNNIKEHQEISLSVANRIKKLNKWLIANYFLFLLLLAIILYSFFEDIDKSAENGFIIMFITQILATIGILSAKRDLKKVTIKTHRKKFSD